MTVGVKHFYFNVEPLTTHTYGLFLHTQTQRIVLAESADMETLKKAARKFDADRQLLINILDPGIRSKE